MFEEVCIREGDPAFGAVHLLTVDAYALQHPEERGPRSNAFHLMRLCRLLEHGDSPAMGARPPRQIGKAFEYEYRTFPVLQTPSNRGDVTVAAVYDAQDPLEHTRRAYEWARAVWDAYQTHHEWARAEAGRHPPNKQLPGTAHGQTERRRSFK